MKAAESILASPNIEARKTAFVGAHVKAVAKKDETAPDAPYGWVEGIANAFEVDRYGDLILPTALSGSFAKFLLNPVLSFGHNIDGNPRDGGLPAGSVLSLDQDANGSTTFRAAFAPTDDAQQVRLLYSTGHMRAFSIHFLPYGDALESRQPTAEEVAKFPGVQRVITKLEMIEIACAVVPVNAGSLMTGAKALSPNVDPTRLSTPQTITGARAMGKTILTSDNRKSIGKAVDAYESHVKALGAVKTHLEELSASGKGEEADHGALCGKCMKAIDKASDTHAAMCEAVKDMNSSVTNQDPEDGDETGDDGGSPEISDENAEKAVQDFEKALKA